MYEVISEDPYWNAIYGTMFTLGLQNGSIDTGYHDDNYYQVVTTLKHFAAYSLGGYQSFTFNAIVSPYMFSDTYFPAFKYVINNANPRGIMCSYNAINGVPACLDSWLLNDTLRQKWGYTGYITSDTGAIKEAYKKHKYTSNLTQAVYDALNATCDIDSGHGHYYATAHDYSTGSPYTDQIPALVSSGKLPEKWVDKALHDSFRIRFELGLFDQPVTNQTFFNVPPNVENNPRHRELNLLATHQVMTLLKNDGILPLDSSNGSKVYAIIGPHYNASSVMVGGYTGQVCREFGDYSCIPGIINGIEKYIDSSKIVYAEGCDVLCNSTAGFANATAVAKQADIIFLLMGLNNQVETEGIDRTNISLPGYQQDLAAKICNLGMFSLLNIC